MAPSTESLPVLASDLRSWLEQQEELLRPHLAVPGPGGLTPRMCLNSARSAGLCGDGSEQALLNCIAHVLHAHRLAGLLDRLGQAAQWSRALLGLAALYEGARMRQRAEVLRAEAAQDLQTAHALEAVESGLGAS